VGVRAPLAVITVLASAATTARADDARVDWDRGLVIAHGIGLADRHAPSPATARGTSRRRAEDAARAAIAKQLPELPLAAGGTVADRAGDAAVKARLDRAVEHAITLDAQPETDGSWRVEIAVPLEAIRQAVLGPRALPAAGDAGPAHLLVYVAVAPSIGWTVAGVPVATLFAHPDHVPACCAQPHATGRVVKPGEIELAGGTTPSPSTLIVIARAPK
jgi:hypothetical protein